MPFSVKYNSGNVTGSIQKGNVALAVNDIAGPTSTTGWYNGPNYTQGTYQIVETSASGDPEVFCPQNEAELVKFAKWKGALSGVTGSSTEALKWIGTQNNLLAINEVYPNIVTDGCILNLDAGFAGSYPVNPSQVNLLYSNGVYLSGNGASGFSSLGLWVTESVITPNNKFRISTGTVFRQAGSQTLRFYVPLAVLTQYQSYNLSFNYQIISGSLFSMTDWNDISVFNSVGIDYGTYKYSSSAGTGVWSGVGGLYSNSYRFMDFAFGTGSIVDIWDIQLTQNTSSSLFNTGSGTTWYSVGSNTSASLINGPSYNTNGYMSFDGTNDYALIPNNPILQPSTSLSLECLLKPNTIVAGSWMIAYTGDANGSFVKYGFRVAGASQLSGYINSNGSIAQTFGNTLVTGSWLHGILTYNGASANLYCNGILVSSTPITGSMDYNAYGSPYFLTMGRKNSIDGQYFNGNISNAKVYNRALSQTEISQNYYQAPIVTNGLVFAADAGNLVSFERGSLTTNSLTGSLTGSLTNGTSYNSENGGAWSFDGVDDSISVLSNADLNFTGSVNLTSEVWINFNLYKDISIVNAKGDGGGQTTAYNYFFIGTNTSFYFRISDGITTQNSPSITSTTLPVNTWGHVVAVLDTTAIRLYLNGIEIGTATTRTINPKANNNPLYISGTTYSLNGKIGISRIYNRALTSTEITQNFNAQKGRFGL